jgi:diguanylate cyclase (GGDEF)-like protein
VGALLLVAPPWPRTPMAVVHVSTILGVVVVPTYFLVGGVVVAGRARQRRLTEEHASLRRVATAVAAGSPPAGIFALVSSEAGRLLGADGAAIVRFRDDDRFDLLGRWSRDEQEELDVGLIGDLPPGGVLERLRAGAAVTRQEVDDPPRRVRVAAPVHTGATLWGALVVGANAPESLAPGAEEHLHDYADLIATAVANAEDRARLHSEAATDALTGLPNGSAFRSRLAGEVARAQRHDRPLTVALIDVDGFRELSDRAGVQVADQVLAEIATLLHDTVGEENVLARMGGDEFAVIFVESDRHQALLVADRARRTVAEAPLLRLRATSSACPTRSCSRTGRWRTTSSRSSASTRCSARGSSPTCSPTSRSPGSPPTTSAPTAAATPRACAAPTCPRARRCSRSPTPGTRWWAIAPTARR